MFNERDKNLSIFIYIIFYILIFSGVIAVYLFVLDWIISKHPSSRLEGLGLFTAFLGLLLEIIRY